MARISHNNRKSGLCARLILAFTALLVSSPVFAYLDPSTGSMVVSAIVGIFASIALAMKTYWYKIKKFFRRSAKPEAQEKADASGNLPVDDSSGADRP